MDSHSTPDQHSNWQSEIASVEHDANRAFLDRDLARLDELFSDDLVVNSPINLINDKKAKPFGAQTVELRVAVTEDGTSDVNLARTYGLFSKNPIGVAFEHADNQKTATYWARWANVRGQAGPWSIPVSMTIAA